MFFEPPRSSANAPIKPTMKLAVTRFSKISNWWVSINRNAKVGLAIAIPGLVLLLFTTPFTQKLAEAWKRAQAKLGLKKGSSRSKSSGGPPKPPKKETHRPDYFKHNTDSILPGISRKSYADAASAGVEPISPLTPDNASISSEGSSEHSHKQKFKLGKNIKKRWQNRPFGHGSSESPLSP